MSMKPGAAGDVPQGCAQHHGASSIIWGRSAEGALHGGGLGLKALE
ncbi:MAG: hypothetical protein AAF559_13815 [Pseudomonadota bacterium]